MAGKKIIPLLLVFLFSSCSFLEPRINVFSGNYSFQKGNYQEALIHYIKALESENEIDIIYYNMGNVYYALGEEVSTFGIWENASGSLEDEVRFRLIYNKGILYFQQGRYEEAYNAFRQALLLKPSSREAKINLEQAFFKESALKSRKTVNRDVELPRNDQFKADDTERLMQYIIIKEENIWGSSPETANSDIPDW